MSNDKNHSEQFERYLKGQMSPEEAHAFERKVLDDPFAREALEGFEAQGIDTLKDLTHLRSRIRREKKKAWSWMRVAAVVALLIVGSFTIYFFTEQMEGDQLAMDEETIEELTQSGPKPDTIPASKEIPEDEALSKEVDNKVKELEEREETLAKKTSPEVEETEALAMSDDVDEVGQLEGKGEALQLAEVEDMAAIEEADVEDDIPNLLQGRVAGVQIAETTPVSNEVFVDTSSLEEVVITAQPLIAKKESVKSALKLVDEEPETQKARQPVARSRSSDSGTVSGSVTDDTGEPLPGVNVVIKGTTTGVTTDIDGNYQLPKIDKMTLVYSFVGFESQEIEVGARSRIDVTMGGATALQEVVVTAYDREEHGSPKLFIHASPKDGFRNYKKYLKDSLHYPEAAKSNEIEGTVILELIINSSGKIDQVDIKRSLGYGCDEEAIRLVKDGPKWEPAKADGNKVEDKVSVRVRFKLD